MASKSGIKVVGLKEYMKKLERMGANVSDEAEIAMKKVCVYGEAEVKKVLGPDGGTRTGKVYETGKSGERYAEHQASAPGEPPAILHGKLRTSISYKIEKEATFVKGSVGPIGEDRDEETDEYSKTLELGREKMAPRPYLVPTLQREAKNMVEIVRKSLKQSLQKYRKK